jgi:kexin
LANKPAEKPAEKPASSTPTGEKAAESQAATDETKRPGMIPSFLPTFGVSGTKQAWIYASAAFIGLFVAGLGIFMCIQKRKRAKQNSRDDYEFAVLENEDEMLTGAGKEKGTKKKARDLYDAFGASDDEDVLSDSDDDMREKGNGGYRDVDSDDDSDSQGSPSGSNR